MHFLLLLCIYIPRFRCFLPSQFLGPNLKLRVKGVLGRSSTLLKSFLNRRFTFSYLEMITVTLNFLSTRVLLPVEGYFFSLPQSFFWIFFSIKPHRAYLFLIFKTLKFHNRFYMYWYVSQKQNKRA